MKKTVAVFFGSKSYEHDVSIMTGLEAYFNIDTTRYDPIPVYIDIEGNWWTGKELLEKRNYPLSDSTKKKLGQATFVVSGKKPFIRVKKGLFSTKDVYFDCALLAFHGDFGEDGPFQGLFETAGIPYTGTRIMASSVFMNKYLTKTILRGADIPVLDGIFIPHPKTENFDVSSLIKDLKLKFPVIVKPNALGSSIGLTKAKNREETEAGLLKIFAMGADALIEECVLNLEEFNVSVTRCLTGETQTSAIERPKTVDPDEILDFTQKYLGGTGKCGAKKCPAKVSGLKTAGLKVGSKTGGLLAMTRDLNPKDLSKTESANIRSWATKAFDILQGTGVVRIDFMCDTKTRKFYLNEVNTIPGSLSFYLWAGANPVVLYPELLTGLIEEAFEQHKLRHGRSVKLTESKIFGR